MYYASNIKFLRKRRKLTQDDVANYLNIKRSTYSGYENEVAEPNLQLISILAKYFNISVDTLLQVDLGSLSESQICAIEDGLDVYAKGSNIRVLATTVNNQNQENVELVPEKAKAGYTRGFADPNYINSLPVFNLPFLSKEKKYRTFQLSGDSMLPIPESAYVTGEFVLDWWQIKDNEACIILTVDEGLVFKIIENRLHQDQSLMLYSLNPVYQPYKLHASEIKEIWKFVHYITSEMPLPRPSIDELVSSVDTIKKDLKYIKEKLCSE